jgi:hypothetical protein
MLIEDLFRPFLARLTYCSMADDPPDPPAGGAGAGDPPGPAATPDPENPIPDPSLAAPEPEPPPDPFEGWTPDAYKKQLARQTRREAEIKAQLQAKEAELAEARRLMEARTAPPVASDPAPARTPAPAAPAPVLDATAIQRQAEFNVEVKQLGERVAKDYEKDWPVVTSNLQQQGGVPEDVMSAILATDEPAYVLVEVGKNPAKFQEILDMPLHKRQNALLKIALGKPAARAAPVRPSGAPNPPSLLPPGGAALPVQGSVNLYDPALSSADHDQAWFAERARQKRESKGRMWSIGGKGA